MRLLRSLCLAVGLMAPLPSVAQMLEFEALDGWYDDNHLAALVNFRSTCDLLSGPEWQPLCKVAADVPDDEASARSFFELFFKPVVVGDPPALFTGYFEPELSGSLTRTPRFAWPLYRLPPEGLQGQSRASIDAGALAGRGLEILWLDDPIDVYFLQIQGSGRVRLPDGQVVRLGYAGKNGHPYRSIGQELVRQGIFSLHQVSAQVIRDWVRRNPGPGQDLLAHNPSYVFFRKIGNLPADKGPIGAMGRSLTTMRSVAIDPAFTPLGVPVWIEKDGAKPLRQLMIAQDTGGAIKGAQRADIFYGTGPQAGDAAGTIKDPGRMVQLLPIDRAYALLPEG
ncbi:MltA domain-containing protein [Xinfangfangia sp. CPCC 101601]|uniref:peptidoglycan lytic exotransglycosylase n=1 Tax=Pseudogemmobacter lacusdianii TaxID=3069608 RepID=A0ABU0VUG5_9RHOB|nr:MltA domain-containing protein [Xinfangfangia sp. CPCC 101601]MDQ2065188.1 MltA domain-containing protein [Xinfangfangia sp. CPCC 101601]